MLRMVNINIFTEHVHQTTIGRIRHLEALSVYNMFIFFLLDSLKN